MKDFEMPVMNAQAQAKKVAEMSHYAMLMELIKELEATESKPEKYGVRYLVAVRMALISLKALKVFW